MITYKLKKIFKGTIASVRSITINKCLKNKEDLKVIYTGIGSNKGKIMTLLYKDLINKKFQIVKSPFACQYRKKVYYTLIDFLWKPDNEVPSTNLNKWI